MTAKLEPDTKTDPLTEEEVEDLARRIAKGKEPECEAFHDADTTPKCTVHVTARLRYACASGGKNVCQAAEDYVRMCQDDPRSVCDDCRQPCSECWRVVKI